MGSDAVVAAVHHATYVKSVSTPTLPFPVDQPPPPPVPLFWNDPQRVINLVFTIAETDPHAASALWIEYNRLRPK